MAKKNKTKRVESTQKKRIIIKLQKFEAYSKESSKSLKEIGLSDKKKFEKHLDVLESEGVLKKHGNSDNYKYWIAKNKIKGKEGKNSSSFLIIWFVSTFVLLFIFILFFSN